MSSHDYPTDDLSSEDEFERALGDLLLTARANDIAITGGWQCDADAEPHDYAIEIYRVI